MFRLFHTKFREEIILLQKFKDYLVGLGPENRLTQIALSLHARRLGYKVDFKDPPAFGWKRATAASH